MECLKEEFKTITKEIKEIVRAREENKENVVKEPTKI